MEDQVAALRNDNKLFPPIIDSLLTSFTDCPPTNVTGVSSSTLVMWKMALMAVLQTVEKS